MTGNKIIALYGQQLGNIKGYIVVTHGYTIIRINDTLTDSEKRKQLEKSLDFIHDNQGFKLHIFA